MDDQRVYDTAFATFEYNVRRANHLTLSRDALGFVWLQCVRVGSIFDISVSYEYPVQYGKLGGYGWI